MEKEKNFTIVDPENMKTMAFLVAKENEDEFCTLQKLDCSIEKDGANVKKTFFFNEPIINGDEKDVVLLTVGDGKALINSAVFQNDKFFISKESTPLEYKMLYSENAEEYKDIKYTPNFKRPVSIIDPEIGEEVKPVLYFDNESNMVKGKVKLLPYKSYIALEVK